MTKILNELILYLRNPVLEKDANQNFWYRFRVLISLLWISITFSFFLSLVNGILTSIGVLHEAKHATDSFLNGDKGLEFLFIAAIVAPIIEELIFRAPLTIFKSPLVLFKNPIQFSGREIILRKKPLVLFKNPKTFKIAFYTIGFIFAYIHIFNFEMSLNVILFSPLLVAPQFFIGLVFGYIRVRFGLIWSICLHSLYNGILISLFLFASNATS